MTVTDSAIAFARRTTLTLAVWPIRSVSACSTGSKPWRATLAV